jgi:ribonucleoside-diphosphate reductase alpha chain
MEEMLDNKTKHKIIYTYDDVYTKTLAYFNGDKLAAEVWISKYALKDNFGNIYECSPVEMHKRIASEFSRVENKYPNALSEDEIFTLLENFKYVIPQGSPMSGIGNNFQVVSLSNCFVVGMHEFNDSYGAILHIDQEQVQLMKRRGGVGHDLSHIRPRGFHVNNSAISATGILPFMDRYSNSTREVAQDGRRGALMLTLSVKHPEIKSFIKSKDQNDKINGANISVKIDDAFMQSVVDGTNYKQYYPIDSTDESNAIEVNAREIWKLLIHQSWKSAEPGVLFWDTIINESVADCYSSYGFTTTATNPCGEIPLCPYDSCRLLAINLLGYVINPFNKKSFFDFDNFQRDVKKAQRLMDDLVDLELEKIDAIISKIIADPEQEAVKRIELELWEKIKEKCTLGRRTGLGITALGDALAALGFRYGSLEGNEMALKVQKTLAISAYECSVDLAAERGSFPIYNSELEINNPFVQRLKVESPELYERMVREGRRNISILTIAPTGTTSLMAQTSSGIEPVFSLFYIRRKKIENNQSEIPDFTDENGDQYKEYTIIHEGFKTYLSSLGLTKNDIEALTKSELEDKISSSPYYKATSESIDWLSKVELQGNLQKWVDHAISVTINLPSDTTEELVEQIFMKAWKVGCKGITIYRDGCRSGVLVTAKEQASLGNVLPKRPLELPASVLQFMNNEEKWVAVVGLFENKPYEIFTGRAVDSFSILSKVKSGIIIKNKDLVGLNRYDFQYIDKDGYKITIEGLSRTFSQEYWNYAKLISGILRHGMPLQYVVDMIEGLNLDDKYLNTWKNGVIRALSKFIPNTTVPKNNVCASCNTASLIYEEGCLKCKNCGYSKCG